MLWFEGQNQVILRLKNARFLTPKNCILTDDIRKNIQKNVFKAVRCKKSCCLFCFSKSKKSGFQKYNHFLKIFFDKFLKGAKILKENVIKVLKVKPHKHPEEKYIGSNAESGGRIY